MENARRFLLYFLPCLFLSLAFLVYPVYVIRPFRPQGVSELMAALTVLRYRPAVMALLLAAALLAVVWYWRREGRKLPRAAAAAGLLSVCGAAALSRVNIYEALMFHPLQRLAFSPATEAKLDGGEKVIAVRLGSAARAYPIRSLSYHHVANDILGGVPIVATY